MSAPEGLDLRTVAHDLRNAAFGVAMNVELIEETAPTEPLRAQSVANVRHELDRIRRIADTITAFAASLEARGAPRP